MDESLIVKENGLECVRRSTKQRDERYNLLLFIIVAIFAAGYGVLMTLIYYDIHHMNSNFDKLMDIYYSAVAFAEKSNFNSTSFESMRYSLNEIANCFDHRNCPFKV
jgi:hypothetical protein